MIVSSSSRGSSIVFTIRPTVVWLSRPRSSVCSSVVLPDPISPVMTTKPGLALDPVAQVVERLAVHAARVQVVGVRAQRERALAKLVEPFVHL